ncbi:alpha/beta hydrolase [[Clostridium] fimetarium]|uniref:Prolyl oligopeptidase family protein n=1 Tax=[Clostridium] fimetarium TaxID=99656 RepID=A0A1I0NPV6_9FIRM|nr:alpha/beta hydrolase [[Clostridium] fimetarium]SEW03332.1 Prolyl oligopeptidase family protein [[Clostridium] fimetarium]
MITKTIDLWKDLPYEGKGNDDFRPTLDTYILKGEMIRGAVLICPGGGYVLTSEREAEPIALAYNSAGFHAFVLYYSVAPNKHPQPLWDVSRAMNIIRENAKEWNIDADKIAVCGFSSGGHLAASLSVHWDKPYLKECPGITDGLNKPNALILAYPVITTGPFAHKGSFENLIGNDLNDPLYQEMSLENQVSDKTPPVFLWHTFDDGAVPVENSLLFAQGLRKNNIPFELHIFPHGPHGLSLANEETKAQGMGVYPHIATWMNLCIEWLKGQFK